MHGARKNLETYSTPAGRALDRFAGECAEVDTRANVSRWLLLDQRSVSVGAQCTLLGCYP